MYSDYSLFENRAIRNTKLGCNFFVIKNVLKCTVELKKKTSVDTHVRVFFFYFSELNNFQTSSKTTVQ